METQGMNVYDASTLSLDTWMSLLAPDGKPSPALFAGMVCLSGALLLMLFAVMLTRRRGKHAGSSSLAIRLPQRGARAKYEGFWQRAYQLLHGWRATRRLLVEIRSRLELTTGYEERSLRKQSAKVFVLTAALMMAMMGIFAWMSRDLFLCALFAAMLGFLADTVLDVMVTQAGNRLMRQQLRFHEQLRHRYYEEKSVDGALESACEAMREERLHDMFIQGECLLDMLMASDTEAAFEQYRQTAPNRYLKLLAGLCRITREYGDARVEEGSVFLKSLGHLSDEIRTELFKREKLIYSLRSLDILTLLPLFFMRPIRMWAGNSFTPMERFYAQGIGTILELVMVLVAVACHACIRGLRHQGEAVLVRKKERTVEARLLDSFLNGFIVRMSPSRFTVRHQQLVTLLKQSVSPIHVMELTARRMLASAAGFLCLLLLCLVLQVQENHHILYDPDLPSGFLGGRLSEQDRADQEEMMMQDRNLIMLLPKNAELEDVKKVLAAAELSPEAHDAAAIRIMEKMERLAQVKFWWWKLLICLMGAVLGWQFPIWYLRYQARIRVMELEDEVARFQSIILMLMHMPRMDVEELLIWMEMFSLHFREPLQSCLSDYNAGAEEALETLRLGMSFAPMTALVGDLILAATDLPILQAFEELESEKQWSRDKRKDANERLVERKRNLGNLIGFVPMYALIGLYLMLPMVASSMSEMQTFYQQMSSF